MIEREQKWMYELCVRMCVNIFNILLSIQKLTIVQMTQHRDVYIQELILLNMILKFMIQNPI